MGNGRLAAVVRRRASEARDKLAIGAQPGPQRGGGVPEEGEAGGRQVRVPSRLTRSFSSQ